MEGSQVGEARRTALQLAAHLGMDETARGEAGIIVTELANNLVKHGGGGELLLQVGEAFDGGGPFIQALALDKGPGIPNLEQALQDGYSTAGSAGTGLGAVRRLSGTFGVYSAPGRGTAVLAQLGPHHTKNAGSSKHLPMVASELVFCGLNVAVSGETDSGDAWGVLDVRATPDSLGNDGDRGDRISASVLRHQVVVADGLGHGSSAAEASRAAVRVFTSRGPQEPANYLQAAHLALRSTRGAAVAVADINLAKGEVRFAGVGNISACIATPGDRRNLVSHNGTVGHQMRKVQEFLYPWPANALLVLHSDGLATHWSLDTYPGLAVSHLALIAGVLYRDFKRGRDDVSIVVGREVRH